MENEMDKDIKSCSWAEEHRPRWCGVSVGGKRKSGVKTRKENLFMWIGKNTGSNQMDIQ